MTDRPIGKILIVDDELELKNALVEALAMQSFLVQGFTSAREALKALREEDFDLLLSDLMMPEMNGIDLIKAAHEIDPHLVAVIMTGQGTIQTAVDAMKIGAFDYVLKPFRLATVMPVLTRAMNTRRLRLENLQLRETVAIYELCQTIAFTLDQQTVISKLADAALQQTDADEVSVLLPCEDGDGLYVAAVRGTGRQRLLGERVPLEETISGWVANERQPLLLEGEINDARFRSLWPHPEIRSAISVPMQVANRLVGTININSLNRVRPFTLGQMKALTILASTAASALESASLYTQVRDAEESYRSIFENAVEGISRSTPEGEFITVNPALARILGYDSPSELLSQITDIAHQMYVHPEERLRSEEIENREGVLRGFEFEAFRKDGEKIWLSLNRRSVRDENGVVLYHEGSVEDITERRRAEEALRASQQLVEGIINAIPVRVFWKDKNLVYLGCNAIFARDAGLADPKEIVGKDDYQLGWRDQAELYRADDREVIETDRPKLLIEEPQTSPDGDTITLLTSKIPLRDSSGKISGVIGTYIDITERKRTEEALKSSEAEMRALFASMTDVILVLDKDGRHLKVAPTRVRNFYQPAPERIGKTLHEIFPKEKADLFLTEINAALETGDTRRVEYSLILGGEELWFDGSVSPMTEDTVVWVARDITERKRAEADHAKLTAEIESQRQRLDNIVATVPGVVWEAWGRPDTGTQRINFVSDYVETMLGYSVEEWLSTPNFWLQIVHPDDQKQAAQDAAEDFAVGGSHVRAFRWMRKDGTSVWVESTSTVITDDEGQPVGMRGVTIDISERKRAAEALRQSEERYRDLVENAHDIIYSHDLEGNYTSVNRAGEQITGYTHAESMAMNMRDTVAPEYTGRIREMMRRKLEGDEATSYEMEILAKNGRRIAVEVNTKLMYQDGVPVGVQGIARDITERKLAQAELNRLAAAVKQTADSILITDPHGNIEYVNPAFERITGYSKEEVLGKNPRILKSGRTDPAIYSELWETISQGGVWAGQLLNRKKDGTLFNERATISAVFDDSGKIAHFLAVKQDITHEIQLEEQLRQSQKMEAIGQLAGGVAHDFNNLLTAINGYSSLALQRIDENHPLRNYLEEIKKAGDRAANLTRQLLAFGRKQILQPSPINLNEVVNDMNKMLRRLIGEDITLIAKLDPLLKKIQADPGQIEQVLVNLVVNARDAMPQGGILTIETASVELDEEYVAKRLGTRPGNYVMLAVSDTGTGMDEQTKARIFDPFFTTKEKGKGTGLGLSTVYGIVKQSGGNIWVYSEPGRGTTFKVYLPQIEAVVTPAEKAKAEVPIPSGTETVLLVEDEDVVRGLARQILEQAGYKVIESSRGREAVRLYSESDRPIDLLLTDVVMPETSGKEVADQLTALNSKLKVLFMSGYTDEAIVHHGVLDSNIEFIQKPFTPAALARKVREVLDANGSSPRR